MDALATFLLVASVFGIIAGIAMTTTRAVIRQRALDRRAQAYRKPPR